MRDLIGKITPTYLETKINMMPQQVNAIVVQELRAQMMDSEGIPTDVMAAMVKVIDWYGSDVEPEEEFLTIGDLIMKHMGYGSNE